MGEDLRHRIAEAIRSVADFSIIAEWICCDPINPDHDLCVKGDTARQMLRAVLADDPEVLFVPSGVVDAVMAVRDEELQRLRSDNEELRKRAELAEAAIVRVREDHGESAYMPGYCFCANARPCPTVRALDGEDTDRG